MRASRKPPGLTREQAVRVYSFETGGTGNYDVQSGIEHGGKRAISTAIGYNQLLTTNSVELMAEQGQEFVRALTARAAGLSGPQRQAMDRKIAVLKADGGLCAFGAGRLVGSTRNSPIRRRAGRFTPWCSISTSVRCCRPTSS